MIITLSGKKSKDMCAKSREFDFEKSLKRLEKIVDEMEEGETPLNRALELFQEGKKLSRKCNKELTILEQKVQEILEKEDGEITTEDFQALEKEETPGNDREDI